MMGLFIRELSCLLGLISCDCSSGGVLANDGLFRFDTRDVLGMCLEVVNGSPVVGASAHRGLARM